MNPEFKKRIEEERAKVAQTPFIILIWGPGIASSSPQKDKRLALRTHLSEHFGVENVVFSEDDDLREMNDRLGLRAAEFYEVSAADIVIIIAESVGGLLEVALYDRILIGKSMVFVENRPSEQQSFASQAFSLLKIETVEPEEWLSCERIRRLALQYAELMRIEKYRRSNA
jgi:hypothetical protein